MRPEFLAIDPGLRKCGVARFDYLHRLIDARTVRIPSSARDLRGSKAWLEMGAKVFGYRNNAETLIIETMQVDARTNNKVGDLLEVQGVAGVLIGIASSLNMKVEAFTPRQWKGSVPKAVTKRRVLEDLLLEERNAIHPRATHDAFDAIGIGLYYLNDRR